VQVMLTCFKRRASASSSARFLFLSACTQLKQQPEGITTKSMKNTCSFSRRNRSSSASLAAYIYIVTNNDKTTTQMQTSLLQHLALLSLWPATSA
jgi:hypothetical protein